MRAETIARKPPKQRDIEEQQRQYEIQRLEDQILMGRDVSQQQIDNLRNQTDPLKLQTATAINRCMIEELDPADYSFVVKRRGTPARPWRWEIYRAGKSGPVESSPVFFESMAEAAKEGKKALAQFLAKRAA